MGELDELHDHIACLRRALTAIRDHGESHEFPCHGMSDADCIDVMRETARAALQPDVERGTSDVA